MVALRLMCHAPWSFFGHFLPDSRRIFDLGTPPLIPSTESGENPCTWLSSPPPEQKTGYLVSAEAGDPEVPGGVDGHAVGHAGDLVAPKVEHAAAPREDAAGGLEVEGVDALGRRVDEVEDVVVPRQAVADADVGHAHPRPLPLHAEQRPRHRLLQAAVDRRAHRPCKPRQQPSTTSTTTIFTIWNKQLKFSFKP